MTHCLTTTPRAAVLRGRRLLALGAALLALGCGRKGADAGDPEDAKAPEV